METFSWADPGPTLLPSVFERFPLESPSFLYFCDDLSQQRAWIELARLTTQKVVHYPSMPRIVGRGLDHSIELYGHHFHSDSEMVQSAIEARLIMVFAKGLHLVFPTLMPELSEGAALFVVC